VGGETDCGAKSRKNKRGVTHEKKPIPPIKKLTWSSSEKRGPLREKELVSKGKPKKALKVQKRGGSGGRMEGGV